MTRRTSLVFFGVFFFGVFSHPEKGRKTVFLGRLDFFPAAGTCRRLHKKKKQSSTQNMTNIQKIPSLLASDTAKGPCKHNRLYLCVGGSISFVWYGYRSRVISLNGTVIALSRGLVAWYGCCSQVVSLHGKVSLSRGLTCVVRLSLSHGLIARYGCRSRLV